MPTYTYQCEVCGEFEQQHSISTVLEECPKCREKNNCRQTVKRLIAEGSSFVLNGGGWASTGYHK